ncbi:MAG: hypothetical protein LBL13_11595 [Bacteroidales bacterium]|nr:hypothetical protein [Bacteroidales bacterium]
MIRLRKMNYYLNQDSQDYGKSRIRKKPAKGINSLREYLSVENKTKILFCIP